MLSSCPDASGGNTGAGGEVGTGKREVQEAGDCLGVRQSERGKEGEEMMPAVTEAALAVLDNAR